MSPNLFSLIPEPTNNLLWAAPVKLPSFIYSRSDGVERETSIISCIIRGEREPHTDIYGPSQYVNRIEQYLARWLNTSPTTFIRSAGWNPWQDSTKSIRLGNWLCSVAPPSLSMAPFTGGLLRNTRSSYAYSCFCDARWEWALTGTSEKEENDDVGIKLTSSNRYIHLVFHNLRSWVPI